MSLEDNVLPDDAEQIKDVAGMLLKVYVNTTNVEGKTSYEGLINMEALMNNIAHDYRASVFSEFLSLLQEKGIEYDYKVFQSDASKAVH